ncbi:MAG: GNAT family N-acetyltransferase [Pirellulales bacterium]
MTVVHFSLDVGSALRVLGTRCPAPRVTVAETAIRATWPEFTSILHQSRAAAPSGLRLPTETGLAGDLTAGSGCRVRVWLARCNGDPSGFASLRESQHREPSRFSIGWLVVAPDFRRAGVGLSLVATAFAAAHARRTRTIHVEVHAGWPEAHGFWSRLAALTAAISPP